MQFFEVWMWFGFAAVGFAVLFNVPIRTLWLTFIIAVIGGIIKLLTIQYNGGIIIGSLLGAISIGFLSIIAAHIKHSPPFIFAIPAVIPMVPGAFAYKTMLGLIHLTYNTDQSQFITLMNETVNNGLKTAFVLVAISLGVSAPLLLTRKESAKNLKIKMPSIK